SSSRSVHKSGVSPGKSTFCRLPLISNRIIVALLSSSSVQGRVSQKTGRRIACRSPGWRDASPETRGEQGKAVARLWSGFDWTKAQVPVAVNLRSHLKDKYFHGLTTDRGCSAALLFDDVSLTNPSPLANPHRTLDQGSPLAAITVSVPTSINQIGARADLD